MKKSFLKTLLKLLFGAISGFALLALISYIYSKLTDKKAIEELDDDDFDEPIPLDPEVEAELFRMYTQMLEQPTDPMKKLAVFMFLYQDLTPDELMETEVYQEAFKFWDDMHSDDDDASYEKWYAELRLLSLNVLEEAEILASLKC